MIPENIEAVTDSWLSGILGSSVAINELTQIGQGIGLMGDIYRVALEADGPAPRSLVVKLPSSFEENRAQGVALGMFESEVRFYRELAPAVAAGLPRVYFAEIEQGSPDFVIVMEDLSDLTMVDQSAGMSADQARAAVEVLAGVHATWWDDAHRPDLDWIPTMNGPRIEFVDQMMSQIFPVFAEGFGDELPEGGLAIYERFVGNYLTVNKAICARSPWTIAHQDFRVENLLFGDDGRVVVLDWQGIGRGPGVYDLAYVLGGSISSELRRTSEAELVALYHERLTDAGVRGYTLAQLEEDYSHAQFMGGLAVSVVTGGSMDLSNDRGRELVATMARRHVQAALDHGGMERLNRIIEGGS